MPEPDIHDIDAEILSVIVAHQAAGQRTVNVCTCGRVVEPSEPQFALGSRWLGIAWQARHLATEIAARFREIENERREKENVRNAATRNRTARKTPSVQNQPAVLDGP